MRIAIYVVAAVTAGTYVLSWTLGRLLKRLAVTLGVVSAIVLRFSLGLLLSLIAARAALHGGYALIIVPLLAALALWNFTLVAGFVWLAARDGLDERA